LRVLAEPDPRVDRHLVSFNAGSDGTLDGTVEAGDDLTKQIVVVGVALHRGKLTAAMHRDDRATRLGDGRNEIRIGEARDVVDQIGAGGERPARDSALPGVD